MTSTLLTGGLGTQQVLDLMSGDDQDRYYAVWHSGKYHVKEALPYLLEALGDEKNRTALGGYPLRRKAAEALGKLLSGSSWDAQVYEQAVPALLQALICEDIWVRSEAAWALGKLAPCLTSGLLRQSIASALLALLVLPDQPYEYLIETLGILGSETALPQIRPFLQNPSERVKCAAARVVFQFSAEPAVLQILLDNLASENMHLRRCALLDLGAVGDLTTGSAIGASAMPANLKLFALKQIFDRHCTQPLTATVLLRQTIEELL